MEEKREIVLYVVTILSLIAFIFIVFGALSKMPSMSDKKFMSLAGNVVLDLEDNFNVGDSIKGNIIISKDETDAYGVLLLSKDNEPLVTQTFNLRDIQKKKMGSGYSIEIDNLVDYKFEEKGNYELFFSVLDLDINIKKKFLVE